VKESKNSQCIEKVFYSILGKSAAVHLSSQNPNFGSKYSLAQLANCAFPSLMEICGNWQIRSKSSDFPF